MPGNVNLFRAKASQAVFTREYAQVRPGLMLVTQFSDFRNNNYPKETLRFGNGLA